MQDAPRLRARTLARADCKREHDKHSHDDDTEQPRGEEQRQVLARILAEVVAEHEEPKTVAGATAPLDHRRLSGIPAVGRGVSGAIFSTDPVAALMAKERSQGR